MKMPLRRLFAASLCLSLALPSPAYALRAGLEGTVEQELSAVVKEKSQDLRWQRTHATIVEALRAHPGGRLMMKNLAALAVVSVPTLSNHDYRSLVTAENERRAGMKPPRSAIILSGYDRPPSAAWVGDPSQETSSRPSRYDPVEVADRLIDSLLDPNVALPRDALSADGTLTLNPSQTNTLLDEKPTPGTFQMDSQTGLYPNTEVKNQFMLGLTSVLQTAFSDQPLDSKDPLRPVWEKARLLRERSENPIRRIVIEQRQRRLSDRVPKDDLSPVDPNIRQAQTILKKPRSSPRVEMASSDQARKILMNSKQSWDDRLRAVEFLLENPGKNSLAVQELVNLLEEYHADQIQEGLSDFSYILAGMRKRYATDPRLFWAAVFPIAQESERKPKGARKPFLKRMLTKLQATEPDLSAGLEEPTPGELQTIASTLFDAVAEVVIARKDTGPNSKSGGMNFKMRDGAILISTLSASKTLRRYLPPEKALRSALIVRDRDNHIPISVLFRSALAKKEPPAGSIERLLWESKSAQTLREQGIWMLEIQGQRGAGTGQVEGIYDRDSAVLALKALDILFLEKQKVRMNVVWTAFLAFHLHVMEQPAGGSFFQFLTVLQERFPEQDPEGDPKQAARVWETAYPIFQRALDLKTQAEWADFFGAAANQIARDTPLPSLGTLDFSPQAKLKLSVSPEWTRAPIARPAAQTLSRTPQDSSAAGLEEGPDWTYYWDAGHVTAEGSDPQVLHQEPWRNFFETLRATAPNAKVLDIGTGNLAIPLFAQGVWPGFDLHAIDKADIKPGQIPDSGKIQFRRADFLQNGYPDGYFNAITGRHALEYPETAHSFPELVRILRPGGSGLFLLHHADSNFVRNARRVTVDKPILPTALETYEKASAYLRNRSAENSRQLVEVVLRLRAYLDDSDRMVQREAKTAHDNVWFLLNIPAGEFQTPLEILGNHILETRFIVSAHRDMVKAALSPEDVSDWTRRLNEAGLVVDRFELFYRDNLPAGWRLEIHKPPTLAGLWDNLPAPVSAALESVLSYLDRATQA